MAFIAVFEELLRQLAAGTPGAAVLPLIRSIWGTYKSADPGGVAEAMCSGEPLRREIVRFLRAGAVAGNAAAGNAARLLFPARGVV